MTADLQPARSFESSFWQPGWWMANIWLLFLLFPIVSVLAASQLSSERKVATVSVLAAFAVVHALGYRALIERMLEAREPTPAAGLAGVFDPKGRVIWLLLLIVLQAVAFVLGGWGVLGAMPFIVSFGVFNFSWPVAGMIGAGSVAVVVVGPLLAGRFEELWFFSAIVISAGLAMVLTRYGEERSHDVSALQTQLRVTEERERVARDVHDVLGHSLTAIVLKTQVTDRMLAAIDEPSEQVVAARAQLAETQDVSRRALAEIRATVSGLRSVELSDELAAARAVLADAGVQLTLRGDVASVPVGRGPLLGWVVREAVTNIVRHARASACTIELGGDERLIMVSDDGIGVTNAREGNGLTGLRERLAAEGLHLRIDGRSGTSLVVSTSEANT